MKPKDVCILVDSTWKRRSAIVYKGNEQLSLLKGDITPRCFLNLKGSFALIYKSDEKLIIAVDCIRSTPIFYYTTSDTIYVSDSAAKIAHELNVPIDEDRVTEFRSCGYVIGNKSLFVGINQLLPCEMAYIDCLNGKVTLLKWHGPSFAVKYSSSRPINQYIEDLDHIMIQVFNDMIDRIGKRQIVVPLSGGLDSRTILYYLKRLGVENVVCLSYGRQDSFEVTISKQVSQHLSYKWIFCEYNAHLWSELYKSQEYLDYMLYAGHGSEIPCYQALPAVKWAIFNNYTNKDAVVVPGHTLDFIGGGHYPAMKENDVWSRKKYQLFIKNKHYGLNKNTSSQIPLNSIPTKILEMGGVTDVLREVFDFELNNRQAKFISNDVRTYEFYGLGYELPFWDIRLVDYFSSLPYDLLHDRRLHRELLREKVDNITGITTDKGKAVDMTVKLQIKEFVKRILPFLREMKIKKVLVESQYRHPDAFYDHMNKDEYKGMIDKYGLGFNIDTMVAESYLHLLKVDLER